MVQIANTVPITLLTFMTGASSNMDYSLIHPKEETDVLLDASRRITNEESPGARLFLHLVKDAVSDVSNGSSSNQDTLSMHILTEFRSQGGRFLERRACTKDEELQQSAEESAGANETENSCCYSTKKIQSPKDHQEERKWFELNEELSLAKILSTLQNCFALRNKEDKLTVQDQEETNGIQRSHLLKEPMKSNGENPENSASYGEDPERQQGEQGTKEQAEGGGQSEVASVKPDANLKGNYGRKRAVVPLIELVPPEQRESMKATPSTIHPHPSKKRFSAKRLWQRNRPPPAPIMVMQPRMVSVRNASAPLPVPAPPATAVPKEEPVTTRTAEDEFSASALLHLHDSVPAITPFQLAAVASMAEADKESILTTAETLQTATNLFRMSSLQPPSALMTSAKNYDNMIDFSDTQPSLVPAELTAYEKLLIASLMVTKADAANEKSAATTTTTTTTKRKKLHHLERATKLARSESIRTRKYAGSFDNGDVGVPVAVHHGMHCSENNIERPSKVKRHCETSASSGRVMRKGQPSGEKASSSKQGPKFDMGPRQENYPFYKQCDEEEALSTRSGESTSQDMETSGQSFSESAGRLSPGDGRKNRKRQAEKTCGTTTKRPKTAVDSHLTVEECALMLSSPATSASDTDLALRVVYEQVQPGVFNSEMNKWQFVCQARGVARVVAAMKRHTSRPRVQSSACDLLLEVLPTSVHTAQISGGHYHAASVVEVVLCAMREHADSCRSVILPKALAVLSILIQGLELECNRVLVCEDVVPEVLSILQQAVSSPPSSDEEENENAVILPFCGDILWHLSQDANGREVIIGYGGAAAVSDVVSTKAGPHRHVLNDMWTRTHFVHLHLRILQDYTGNGTISCYNNAMLDQSPFSLVAEAEGIRQPVSANAL